MRPRILAVFVCLSISLWSALAHAQSNDPSELFLNGYQSAQKGEKQEASRNLPGALQSFQDAAQQLDQIRTRFPTWNPSIVDFRYKRIQEAIARVQKGAPAGGLTAPGSGSDTEPTLPKDGAEPIIPEETLPKPTKNTKQTRVTPGDDNDPLTKARLDREHLLKELEDAKQEKEKAEAEAAERKSQLEAIQKEQKAAAVQKANLESRTAALEAALTAERSRANQDDEKIQSLTSQVKTTREQLTDLVLDNEARAQVETQREKMRVRALSRANEASMSRETAEKRAAEADARVAAAQKKADEKVAAIEQKAGVEVAEAKKQMTQAIQDRDEAKNKLADMTKQRDDAMSQLAKLKEGAKNVDKLVAENGRLMAKLEEANKQIAGLQADSTQKDQLIASLKKEVTTAKEQLAESQKQSSTFQAQMVDLKTKLETASADLEKQRATNATATAEKKKMIEENDILRGIVIKQMKEAARESKVRMAVLTEIKNSNVGKDVAAQIGQLGQPVQLTAKERGLFKQPLVELGEPNDIVAVSPQPPPSEPPAPLPDAAPVAIPPPVPPTPPAPSATPAATPPLAAKPEKSPKSTSAATPQPLAKLETPKNNVPPPAEPAKKPLSLEAPATDAIAPLPEGSRPPAPPPSSAETRGESMPPTNSTGMPPDLLPMVQRAKDEFDHGNYRDAEKTYEDILRKAPTNVYALSNLGVVRYRSGKFKLAEEAFHKAIAIAPEDGFSHTTLGIVEYVQNKYDDAVNELTKALAINPKNPTAHNYLGITASQKGWGEAAQKELETAVALDGNYADAWFNLAVVYATKQPPDKENARRCYKKATELGAEADPSLEQLIK